MTQTSETEHWRRRDSSSDAKRRGRPPETAVAHMDDVILNPRYKYFVADDNNQNGICIGCFSTQKDAERAYDMTCYNLRGEFAVLNNPDNVFKNAWHVS